MINFRSFPEVLSKVGQLPRSTLEIFRLKEKTYNELFSSLTEQEQQVVSSHSERADRCVKELKERPSGEIYATAVESLLIIGDYLNRKRFLGDHSALLQPLYDSLSEDERRDILPRVISCEPQHVWQKIESVFLFKRLAKEKRDIYSYPVHVLAKPCMRSQDRAALEMFLENKPANTFHTYLGHLATILPKIKVDRWPSISFDMGIQKEKIASILATLMKSISKIDSDILSELIKVVKIYQDKPHALFACCPLLSLCKTKKYLAHIAHAVAQLPDLERRRLVREVVDASKSLKTDEKVYRKLREIIALRTDSKLSDPFEIESFAWKVSVPSVNKPLYPGPDITLTKEQVEEDPVALLYDILRFIEQKDASTFSVAIEGEKVFSARDFIPMLFRSVCRHMHFIDPSRDTLYLEKTELTWEEEKALTGLGKMLIYCFENGYHLEKQVDKSVFIALCLLRDAHLLVPLSEMHFDVFYPIYRAMKGLDGREEEKKSLIQAISNAIIPCIAIRRGIKKHLGITGEQFQSSIEGKLCKLEKKV